MSDIESDGRVMVALDSIDEAAYNPRKMRPGPFSKLKRSLEHFGQVEPIIVNRRTENLVGGHQRLRAMKELGWPAAWVTYVDLDLEQEKALNVTLNNAELAGEWDTNKLGELLAGISKAAQELTGFDAHQVAGFIERAKQTVEVPVYPLAAKMLEHYDYVVVFTTNETDWMNLQALLQLETQSSYKKQKVGLGRVLPFERFLELWNDRDGSPGPKPKGRVRDE